MKKQLTELKDTYEKKLEEYYKKGDIFSKTRIFLFFCFLILVFFYSNYSSWFLILLLSGIIILFLAIVMNHSKLNREIKKYEVYLKLLERYENRMTNKWKEEENETISTELLFLEDLNITGKNSLFQFLNFTSSLGGKEKLVNALSLKKVTKKNILANQMAIEELKNNFEFVLFFQEKMTHVKNVEKINFKNYYSFFAKKEKDKKIEMLISFIFSIFTILTFLLSCFQILDPVYFVGLFFFQLAASFLYASIYREEFEEISRCVRTFSSLKDVYHYIEGIPFQSKKNESLRSSIQKGEEILGCFHKISTLNSYRFNLITNLLFNIFFSLNFRILYQYTKLLKNENSSFKESIEALEEFELLISLSTIAFVKEQIVLPMLQENISLEMIDMKHPLLEENTCVANNFQCNQDIQIITGSNMSGKTSFMRTIGVNLILAYTGTYVTASRFSCSIMKIFTSINVKDDISNGISTFYGELKRIKEVLDFSKEKKLPMIVFIDEIFKGTNYNDRILGAKEVLKKLSGLPCIVFLTTHDFELCEINNRKVHNYHFEETYQKNKIFFDYKIKKGQCKTTNAKYLMKEIGIID